MTARSHTPTIKVMQIRRGIAKEPLDHVMQGEAEHPGG